MRKVMLALLVVGLSLSIAGCGSSKSSEETSVVSSEQSTEDSSVKENEKMKKMEADLGEKGVEISCYDDFMYLTREKGIDSDYFEMTIVFADGIYQVRLTLKGNIDGKDKKDLIYKVSNGRLVESSGDNTDITELDKVLKSIDYSDKDIIEFAQWYREKNK